MDSFFDRLQGAKPTLPKRELPLGTQTDYEDLSVSAQLLGELKSIAIDFIGMCLVAIVFTAFITLVLFSVARLVVRQRNLVIRLGRRIQNLLRLPEWMRLIADEYPGMMNKDVRTGATVLVFSVLWIGMDVGYIYEKGTVWDPAQSYFTVPLVVYTAITWVVLLRAKRRLVGWVSPDTPLVEYEGYEKEQQPILDPSAGDGGWEGQLERFADRRKRTCLP